MKPVELKYRTPNGTGSAFVFVGEDGLVTSESGLDALMTTLRRCKAGGVTAKTSIDAQSLKAFLDLAKPCPRESWKLLRAAYARDIQAAANCTTCRRSTIARKYTRLLYEQADG